MKYKEISPPFLYYFSIFVGVCCFFACAFIFDDMMQEPFNSSQISKHIIISIFGMLVIRLTIERTNKYIYARVDLETKTLIYGNAFFKQEVDINIVEFGKPGFLKRIFEKKTYKIVIGHNSYFIYFPSNENLKEYFDSLRQ